MSGTTDTPPRSDDRDRSPADPATHDPDYDKAILRPRSRYSRQGLCRPDHRRRGHQSRSRHARHTTGAGDPDRPWSSRPSPSRWVSPPPPTPVPCVRPARLPTPRTVRLMDNHGPVASPPAWSADSWPTRAEPRSTSADLHRAPPDVGMAGSPRRGLDAGACDPMADLAFMYDLCSAPCSCARVVHSESLEPPTGRADRGPVARGLRNGGESRHRSSPSPATSPRTTFALQDD